MPKTRITDITTLRAILDQKPNLDLHIKAVAVLGFCVWGANRAGIFVWGAKGGLSDEGAKLRLPKARSPSRLGGLGGVVSSPSWVWGGAPETDAVLNISSQRSCVRIPLKPPPGILGKFFTYSCL